MTVCFMFQKEHRQELSKQSEKNTMKNLIACCGLDCETCNARVATLNNDNELRENTAKLWSGLNGVPITPDMINCLGCRTEGIKTPFCDKLCPIHQCVLKKGLATCGDCPDRGGCPTVGAVWNSNSEAKSRLLERDR